VTLLQDLDFIRKHAKVSHYRNMRVLITGATGFVGSWLSYALSNQCRSLTLCNHENYAEALYYDYDLIFHLAPVDIRPVIDTAYHTGAKVLFTSSGAVYGGVELKPVELCPTRPKTEYGSYKLRDELTLKTSGLDYVNARLFAFAGRGMKDHFAITAFVNAAKQGRPLKLMGGGKMYRSYLYAADLAVWLINLMVDGRGTYNVGSEREITIKDLARSVAEHVIPNAEIIEDPRPFDEPAPYYVPNCDKAHALGLMQVHDLDYAIRRMLE